MIWAYILIIAALRRLRQKDSVFKNRLGLQGKTMTSNQSTNFENRKHLLYIKYLEINLGKSMQDLQAENQNSLDSEELRNTERVNNTHGSQNKVEDSLSTLYSIIQNLNCFTIQNFWCYK